MSVSKSVHIDLSKITVCYMYEVQTAANNDVTMETRHVNIDGFSCENFYVYYLMCSFFTQYPVPKTEKEEKMKHMVCS